ncbi:DUF3325 domain-containing protein [Marilutibacter aestuarii]|uniref:DUF3325 domain-containing protein n=1 Tax=Marilutibacter aestuarii TaxID=1706195 RepID=A0A507ZRE9_9GAMM|nr:DUF3325 domain-containing protein [Lysobacter aestuarii]TQD40356.1 DUF3325 domain-containing protein [Lysobacter aestuarii]
MSECLLALALSACVVGMGWLALAMDVHARQAWGRPAGAKAARTLRAMGTTALVLALVLCLQVDHATMAVLVWVMALAVGAVSVAMVLAWRARWLGLLAPWTGRDARKEAPASTPDGHRDPDNATRRNR